MPGLTLTNTGPLETAPTDPLEGDTVSHWPPELELAEAVKFCACVPRFEIPIEPDTTAVDPCGRGKLKTPVSIEMAGPENVTTWRLNGEE